MANNFKDTDKESVLCWIAENWEKYYHTQVHLQAVDMLNIWESPIMWIFALYLHEKSYILVWLDDRIVEPELMYRVYKTTCSYQIKLKFS